MLAFVCILGLGRGFFLKDLSPKKIAIVLWLKEIPFILNFQTSFHLDFQFNVVLLSTHASHMSVYFPQIRALNLIRESSIGVSEWTIGSIINVDVS